MEEHGFLLLLFKKEEIVKLDRNNFITIKIFQKIPTSMKMKIKYGVLY